MWTRKDVDLAPHPVVGLVLLVGDAKKLTQAFGFKSFQDLFSESASRVHDIDRCRIYTTFKTSLMAEERRRETDT